MEPISCDSLRQVSVAELTPPFFLCFVRELGITKIQLLPRENQREIVEWDAEYASFSSHSLSLFLIYEENLEERERERSTSPQ